MRFGNELRMDLKVRAFRIVQPAISEPIVSNNRGESGRKDGLEGGPSRARSIGAKYREEIAKIANAVRWATKKGAAH
jgi:hypothetical protein